MCVISSLIHVLLTNVDVTVLYRTFNNIIIWSQVKQEPGSVHVKEELPSVDSGAVTTPKTEPMDGTEDTKQSSFLQ